MYKILVVDDDFEILKLMRTILEMKNYEVTTYQEVLLPVTSADVSVYLVISRTIRMYEDRT